MIEGLQIKYLGRGFQVCDTLEEAAATFNRPTAYDGISRDPCAAFIPHGTPKCGRITSIAKCDAHLGAVDA